MPGPRSCLLYTSEKLVRDIQIDAAILEAEKEVREGAELMDAREALVGLRRKHGA